MVDKIKSNLTTAYMLFIFDFADPSDFDSESIKDRLSCPLKELFNTQKSVDRAKKDFTKEDFSKLLGLFFSQYQTSDGLDYKRLSKDLTDHKKQYLRHLGKDKLNYLSLLTSLMKILEPVPKRGLLFNAS